MGVDIQEEPIASLADHAALSIAFRVEKKLELSLVDGGLGGFAFQERTVEPTFVKDNDETELPNRWPHRFDVANWGLIAAHDQGVRIGGAVIAFDTEHLYMLDRRTDLAALWDLRVDTGSRRAGIGTLLFRAAEQWARERECSQLKIETQNINVPACRFYVRMGCTLGGINRYTYPEHPEEVQLLWFKDL